MCNRYENRGSASVIRRLSERFARDFSTTPATDNLPPADDIYPDQDAAIVRNRSGGGLELTMARWGLPRSLANRRRLPTSAICKALGGGKPTANL